MTLPEIVAAVITALGSQALLIAGIAWLTRKIVSHGLDRDLEEFKAKLKSESDREVEHLKNTLEMTALEHRVRFSKLHERRARVIATLYRLITEAEWSARGFVHVAARNQDRANEAALGVRRLFRYFQLNRLYLPDPVCIIVTSLINKMFGSVSAIQIYFAEAEHPTTQMRLEQNKKMLEVIPIIETEIPGLKSLLESEFRKLLGALDEEWLPDVTRD
jgi:hypothetical protein